VAGMDAGVDSFGELAATAADIVPVGVFDDDAFGGLLGVSTVAPWRLGGAGSCNALPSALAAIVVDLRREGLRREGCCKLNRSAKKSPDFYFWDDGRSIHNTPPRPLFIRHLEPATGPGAP
jgi:hypothetical protein